MGTLFAMLAIQEFLFFTRIIRFVLNSVTLDKTLHKADHGAGV